MIRTANQYKLPLFFLIGIGFLFATSIINAQRYTRTNSRVYEVFDDYVQVTETRKIQINQSNIYIPLGNSDSITLFADIRPDAEDENNSEHTINSLSVKHENGSNYQNYKIDNSGSNPILNLNFDRDIDIENPFSVNISYKSKGIIYKSGKVRDILIPGFSSDFEFNNSDRNEIVTTTVRVPKSMGEISFAIPNGDIQMDGEYYVINFNQDDLIGRSGWIEVGTEQIYEFKINQPFPKSSDLIFGTNTYTIILPRDIESGNIVQKVFFTKISPEPISVYKDENGNTIAKFSVPSNIEGEILIEGFARLHKKDIQFSNFQGNLSDIPQDIIGANTSVAEFWEADHPDIKAAALEAIGDLNIRTSSVFEISERIYKYVIDRIDYSHIKRFGINERQGALVTLKGGAAVCMEYSDLYTALLRSIGIPARAALGYGYTGTDSSDSSEHQWVEVYIPELGWISVDTTWGESAPELIGGDLNHFFMHVASINPQTPAPAEVSFVGSINRLDTRTLTVYPVDNVTSEGETVDELIAKFPEEQSSEKSRDITIRTIFVGIQDFYQRNNIVINIFTVVTIMLIVTVVIRNRTRRSKALSDSSKLISV